MGSFQRLLKPSRKAIPNGEIIWHNLLSGVCIYNDNSHPFPHEPQGANDFNPKMCVCGCNCPKLIAGLKLWGNK